LVDKANHLDIVLGIQPLSTCNSIGGNDAGAVASLGAPGDDGRLDVTDGLAEYLRCEETEVIKAVKEGSLRESDK
jgi:hypothetical protein